MAHQPNIAKAAPVKMTIEAAKVPVVAAAAAGNKKARAAAVPIAPQVYSPIVFS